jgi:hypothetical protein
MAAIIEESGSYCGETIGEMLISIGLWPIAAWLNVANVV